jgi:chemotaxis protein MotB
MSRKVTEIEAAEAAGRRSRTSLRRLRVGASLIAVWACILSGCNQNNPYLSSQQPSWQQQQALTPNQSQMFDLSRRASDLDQNNRDLHAQLAQSRQQVQVLREQVGLLQSELGETAQRLKQEQVAKAAAERRYASLEESTARRGGAVITANNSLHQSLRPIEIPGLDVRTDGDAIRISIPSDQLFSPGTAQLVGSAFPILDGVASELAKNYPRQLIGIEGHTDTAPVYGGATNHQLAAAQAMAVFDQFTRRNRLPSRQFLLIAHGANRPVASNGTQDGRSQNRRIELIVYPELADDA